MMAIDGERMNEGPVWRTSLQYEKLLLGLRSAPADC